MSPTATKRMLSSGLHSSSSPTTLCLFSSLRNPTFQAALDIVKRVGKTAAYAEDFPAFIVNRILLPMINEAVYTLYEGVGSVEAIDTAMRLGAQLLASGYNLQIRMGAHSGFWKLNPALEGAQHPEISDIVVVAARIEPLARPGDILLSQQFVDDAQRYGYRFEEEGFSLLDDQYVGAGRYQAGAGVLISKDSETAQHIPIYLFDSAADASP